MIKYRPEIDGLRAWAVIPVILFHLNRNILPGGFLGVDVFFVISGFLITSIIAKEVNENTFSLRSFWLRRINRIGPALCAVLAFTAITGYYILYSGDKLDLGWQTISAAFSAANIYFWRSAGNYWGGEAENSALLHTWSLAVEEQFYLFYPIIAFSLLRWCRQLFLLIVILGTVASLALFVYGSYYAPGATFYLLPTRAWELGVGCALALSAHRIGTWNFARRFSVIAALLILVITYLTCPDHGGTFWNLLAVLGAALIVAFPLSSNIWTSWLIANPLITYIGKISYSLYLWHWPVMVLLKNYHIDGESISSPWLILLATIVFSVASYHLIEIYTRRRRNVLVPILMLCLMVLPPAMCLIRTDRHEDISGYSRTVWAGQVYNVAPDNLWPECVRKRMVGIEVLDRSNKDGMAYANGGYINTYGGAGGKPDLVVFGDSHALMWAPIIDQIANEMKLNASFLAADGTSAFFSIPPQRTITKYGFSTEEKLRFDESRIEFMKKWNPRVVLIGERWNTRQNVGHTDDLFKLLRALNVKVLLIGSPPILPIGDRNAPRYLSLMGMTSLVDATRFIPYRETAKLTAANAFIENIAHEYSNCTAIVTSDLYYCDGNLMVLHGRDVLYIDDDHLSLAGALMAKDRIKNEITKALDL